AIFSNKLATSSLSWAGDRTSRSSGGLTQSLNRTPPRRTKRIMHPCPGFCPYYLLPGVGGDLAKKDAWTVKITLISKDYEPDGEAAAILQREDVIGAAGSPC